MFKAISNGRPYPDHTWMSTDKWAQIVPKYVQISDLIATQDGVYLHALMPEYKRSYSGDWAPHAVKWQGQLYLEDGHSRVIRTLLKGQDRVIIRILDLDDLGHRNKI